MRSDLDKQLCESPRFRSWDKYSNYRNYSKIESTYNKITDNDDDVHLTGVCSSQRESMKHRFTIANQSKSFGEHFAPLKGIIRTSVGRCWDTVFSELCQAFDMRKATSDHILVHLYSWLEVNTFMHDGVVCYNNNNPVRYKYAEKLSSDYSNRLSSTIFPITDSYASFYVHPLSGCVCANVIHKSYKSECKQDKAIRINTELQTHRVIDSNIELFNVRGVWYICYMKMCTDQTVNPVDIWMCDTKINTPYPYNKKSMSNKEMKTYGVVQVPDILARSGHKRTLIRLKHSDSITATVQLPDIWPNLWFQINILTVPRDKRSILHPGFCCWVTINANVSCVKDLVLTDWSL